MLKKGNVDETAEVKTEVTSDDIEFGVDRFAALAKAEEEGNGASPCAFCNRMDCMSCSLSR